VIGRLNEGPERLCRFGVDDITDTGVQSIEKGEPVWFYSGLSSFKDMCLEQFGSKRIDPNGECECTIADAVELDEYGMYACDCEGCEDWRWS
jgi:hypothetical protein